MFSNNAEMDGHSAMRSRGRACLTPRDIPSRKEEYVQGHRGLNKHFTLGYSQWFSAAKEQKARLVKSQGSLALSKEYISPRGQQEASEGFLPSSNTALA